jgi:hypothetical protein
MMMMPPLSPTAVASRRRGERLSTRFRRPLADKQQQERHLKGGSQSSTEVSAEGWNREPPGSVGLLHRQGQRVDEGPHPLHDSDRKPARRVCHALNNRRLETLQYLMIFRGV